MKCMGSNRSTRAKKPAAKAAAAKAPTPRKKRAPVKSGLPKGGSTAGLRASASLSIPAAQWEVFLEAMARTNNATYACQASGIHRNAVFARMKEDSLFKAQYQEASLRGIEACEDEVRRRAFHGTRKPVFYQGGHCGDVREYSDQLAMFILKAEKPDRYRDKLIGAGLQPHEHAALVRQALKEIDEQTAADDE